MATPRKCGTCVHHVPGVDRLSGQCAHPLRGNSHGIAVLVRNAELACRTDWGTDCWSAAPSGPDVTLRIWGPFTPGELKPDSFPIDLIDWLVRHG